MRIRWFIIIALGLIGLIWLGQGLGLIRGSGFMTDDIRWAAFGAALLGFAIVFGIIERRRRPKA